MCCKPLIRFRKKSSRAFGTNWRRIHRLPWSAFWNPNPSLVGLGFAAVAREGRVDLLLGRGLTFPLACCLRVWFLLTGGLCP